MQNLPKFDLMDYNKMLADAATALPSLTSSSVIAAGPMKLNQLYAIRLPGSNSFALSCLGVSPKDGSMMVCTYFKGLSLVRDQGFRHIFLALCDFTQLPDCESLFKWTTGDPDLEFWLSRKGYDDGRTNGSNVRTDSFSEDGYSESLFYGMKLRVIAGRQSPRLIGPAESLWPIIRDHPKRED